MTELATPSLVEQPTRRDFLYIATGAFAAVGGAAAVWPFISQMNPDASTLALASTDVDVSAIAEGQAITIKWRGKPVFIRHRTAKEIEDAKAVPLSELIDQDALTRRVVSGEIFAILDVTVPWVLEPEHPLYRSDNALLTPHIAGSLGTELGRLSATVLGELRRLAAGEPLEYAVEPGLLAITA